MLRKRPSQRRRLDCAIEALERRTLLSGFSFGSAVTTTLPFVPMATASGDFNGDGKADLAIAVNSNSGTHPGTVAVLMGDGNGTFQSPIYLSSGAGAVAAVTVADLTGDGNEDIIAADDNGSVSIFMGNGNGTFKPAEVYSNICHDPISVAVGNFNGHEDIAIADVFVSGGPVYGNVLVMMGNGDGTFNSTPQALVVGGNPDSLAVGNFNGHDDLVVGGTFTPGCVLELCDGQGNFTSVVLSDGVNDTTNVQIADVNGDGLPDIIASSAEMLAVFVNNGNGTFKHKLLHHNGSLYTSVATGDFAGDGQADLVEIQGGGLGGALMVASGNGDGTFASGQALTINGLYNSTLVVDVAGDGGQDIVSTNRYYSPSPYGKVTVLMSNQTSGDLRFSSPPTTTFATGQAESYLIQTESTSAVTLSLADPADLPAGATFTDNGNGTATISGTETALGSYNLTIAATNAQGRTVDQNFTLLVILPQSQQPVIIGQPAADFLTGEFGSMTIATTGTTGNLTEKGELPSGVSFVDEGNGAGFVSGIPAIGSDGVYVFTIADSISGYTYATQEFTIDVNVPSPQFEGAVWATFVEGNSESLTINTNSDAGTITERGTLPVGIVLNDNGDGTATLQGIPLKTGTYFITLSDAVAGSSTALEGFTLYVDPPPLAISTPNSAQFVASQSDKFVVQSNTKSKVTYSLTGNLPAGVSFQNCSNGSAMLTGKPKAAADGTYCVTLSATSGAQTATQMLTLNIAPSQAVAIDGSNNVTLNLNNLAALPTWTATGYPVPTITETGKLPAGLTFQNNVAGTASLVGTPSVGSQGVYHLVLHAGNKTEAVTLTLALSPTFITATAATFAVGRNVTFHVATTGFPAATLTESGALPAGVRFKAFANGTATISGKPAANSGGAYTISLTAANGANSTTTQDFTLNIIGTSSAPIIM